MTELELSLLEQIELQHLTVLDKHFCQYDSCFNDLFEAHFYKENWQGADPAGDLANMNHALESLVNNLNP